MAKKPVPVPPPEALPEGESNRYVAKFKASLGKRWSYSRSETLYEIFDLAAFLWALERADEAVAVAAAVADAVPDPPPLSGGRVNYTLWCPATYSHALVVRLGGHKMPERREVSRAALLGDAGIARDNPTYLAERVENARSVAAAPSGQDSMKWECRALARAVGTIVLFSDLAAAGDALFAPHAADAALIPPLLAKLGATLRGA
jgi:hypothetical protein